MCRQRRRTWGQGWPWAGLRARMKRHCAAPGFTRCGQEKAPRTGLVGSGFVHEAVLALTREEDMLPRVDSGVPTFEQERKRVVSGNRGYVRVDHVGRPNIKKQINIELQQIC